LKQTTIAARISLILICVLSLLVCGCQDKPLSSFENARSALRLAAGAGAVKYAEKQYREAETLLKNGRLEMARQNGRLAFLRDYKVADSLFKLSSQISRQAIKDAEDNRNQLRWRAEGEFTSLQKELAGWREAMDGSLRVYNAERYWSSGEMSLQICRRLINKGEYQAASEAIARGRAALDTLSEVLADYATDAARGIKVWRNYVQETVKHSRDSETSAIIVDKAKHKLYLIKDGNLIRTFDCDLGYNSAREKFFAGDGSTPEGQYHVTKVKTNGSSKYYKAFLINYPNERDKARFAENKAKGIISRYARIGALIEIHGSGGRDEDWTDGCIALTNKEMDYLMKFVTVGTPVTIVRRSDQWP